MLHVSKDRFQAQEAARRRNHEVAAGSKLYIQAWEDFI
jgi:hypothetical protein